VSAPIGGDLGGYYRLHAPIYDLTRPAFLFGRERVLERLRAHWPHERAPAILEIGCGTGSNLAGLARRFPGARLVGLDLAEPMLERARRRLGDRAHLIRGAAGEVDAGGPFDIVLLSYVLTMTGSAQASCIAAAHGALAPGGLLGVVDFESTPLPAFARWMAVNHVRFDPELPERVARGLAPLGMESQVAYLGAWRWFLRVCRR
jgi:S-adenosylmethionine-diacylgycerolhomoserine-N-methlytransferase